MPIPLADVDHRRTVGAGIACAILLGALACGDGASGAATAMARDSAGVRIVESTAPAWGENEGWRLSSMPRVDIGVVEGDPHYQLDRVTRALRLSDGRIVVVNASTQELRYYDATGEYLSTSGRRGGGPGEFKSVGWIGLLPGDSLLAFDVGNRRLSLFDPSGRFVRSTTVEQVNGLPFISPAGRFADGSLAMRGGHAITRGTQQVGLIRGQSVYLRYGRDGSLIDTIAQLPDGESYVKSTGPYFSVTTVLFGHSPVNAVLGSELYYGSSDSYAIRAYAPDGTLRRIVRYARPPVAVTDADVDEMRQRQLAALRSGDAPGGAARQRIERMFAEAPVAKTMPAYDRLLVDSRGDLWVEDYRRPTDTVGRWRVFDRDGRMLGTVVMPHRFTPTDVGADYVLGIWRDELDVEHVRLYGLEKERSTANAAAQREAP